MNIWNTTGQDSYNRVEEMSKTVKKHGQAMQGLAVIRSSQLQECEPVLTWTVGRRQNIFNASTLRKTLNFQG
jgi:hypothetical protein